MRALARNAGVMTPHMPAGRHLSHRDTALVLRAAGLSPLGPVAVNVAAPDEGNMFLLSKVASPEQQARYLQPLLEGRVRSTFMMTEPAAENGAGSDPSMLMTVAEPDGDQWIINGRKCFSTGLDGASVAIVMAKTGVGATMFLVDLPQPAIRIERVPHTLDSSMPGGHPTSRIENLRLDREAVLGEVGKGFKYAQVRLSPARLTHCMRWLGACTRAQEIASEYAVKRQAFGRMLIDHEGVGYMLADNRIELKQMRTADRLVCGRSRCRFAGDDGVIHRKGRRFGGAVPDRRPLRPDHGRDRRDARYHRRAGVSRGAGVQDL